MAVLDVQNLTLSFGENTLFEGVSFDIKEKEKVGLIGCNGAGKTSLFRIITGEYEPTEGNCFISKNVKLGYMEQMLKDCFGKSYFAEIFRSSEAE